MPFDVQIFANVMFYLGAALALNTDENKAKSRVCGYLIITIAITFQVYEKMEVLSAVSAVLLCLVIKMIPEKWAEAIMRVIRGHKEKSHKKENLRADFDNLIDANQPLSESVFLDYVLAKGIDNVTKEELIQIVRIHKLKTWQAIPGFNNIMYFKLLEENNRTIEKWTKYMGILTILVTIMTAMQLYKAFK